MNLGRTGYAWFRRQWEGREQFRFLVVGAYNTLFGYLFFAGIFFLFKGQVHYLVILLVSHLAAVTNAFIGHRRLTFRMHGHLLADFFRFNLAYLGALGLGLVGLPLLVEVLHIHPLASQAALTGIVVATSYLLHKHVSFRRPALEKPPQEGR